MPRTAESPEERQKRLDRARRMFAPGVVDMGEVEMGPVTVETNRRPEGATEVSRADFQRRRRPVVSGIDDVEIGEAEIEAPTAESMIGDAMYSRDPEAIAGRTTASAEAQLPETQARLARERAPLERDADRERRRDEAYERSVIDGWVMDSDNIDAFGRGTAQGVTLGFGDELAGLNVAPWDMQPQPRGFGRPERATYASERDRVRRENETAQRAAPRAYAGGEVLGSALPALALPGPSARTALGRIGQAGLVGGAFGGTSGLGHGQGDARQQALETAQGAGYGFAGGAAGQMVGEGLAAGHRWLDAAPEGTPRPGTDFTPEQQAQIRTRGGDVQDMAGQREQAERAAAVRRIQTAHPNITAAELRAIDGTPAINGQPAIPPTYEGGIRGLARDMDASGISPRRSMSGTPEVQRRAGVVDMEPPPPAMPPPPMPDEVQMPPGARPGQFPDDEGVRMAPASGARPTPGRWTDDIPADPADAHPFDPTMTEEAKANRIRAELQARAQARAAERNATMSDAERAAAEEVTPRPTRPAETVSDDAFAAVTNPPTRRPVVDMGDDAAAVPAGRTAEAERQHQAQASFDRQFGGAPSAAPAQRPARTYDEAAAQRQANILAAERRQASGSLSHATQEERAWPVRDIEVEDITPQAAPERAPAQPPPLPRRPAPQATQPDLGRWDAPPTTSEAPAPPAPRQTPGQRAAPVVREMGRGAELERMTRGTPTDQRGLVRRAVEDQIVSRFLAGRGAGAMASGNEAQADMLAREVVRRLADDPAARTVADQLRRTLNERGPRAFGLALQVLHRRQPELDDAIMAALPPEEGPYVPPRLRPPTQGGEQQPQPAGEQSEWDTPFRPGVRR